jgi:hypothetical protein
MEAAALLLLTGVGLKLLPFATVRRLLNRYIGVFSVTHDAEDDRAIWAVRSVSRRMPIRTTCLIEALTADAMLRRRGYECKLCLGVMPPGTTSESLTAHAWVERQGTVVLGEIENLKDYAVLPRSL